ncbi:hypothetical protein D3C86_1163060 [compost metagenome]
MIELGRRVHALDPGLELLERFRRDEVDLVEEDDVGEGDLLLHLVAVVQVLPDMLGIHQGDDAVQAHLALHLLVDEEGLGDRAGVRHTRRLDDDVVELVLALHEVAEDPDEVTTHGAADAAVIHLEDLFFGADHKLLVDAYFTELVFDHSDALTVLSGEDMVQKGGFSRPEKAGEHRDRYEPGRGGGFGGHSTTPIFGRPSLVEGELPLQFLLGSLGKVGLQLAREAHVGEPQPYDQAKAHDQRGRFTQLRLRAQVTGKAVGGHPVRKPHHDPPDESPVALGLQSARLLHQTVHQVAIDAVGHHHPESEQDAHRQGNEKSTAGRGSKSPGRRLCRRVKDETEQDPHEHDGEGVRALAQPARQEARSPSHHLVGSTSEQTAQVQGSEQEEQRDRSPLSEHRGGSGQLNVVAQQADSDGDRCDD